MIAPFFKRNTEPAALDTVKKILTASFILAVARTDGTIIELNQNFQNAFGYRAEELQLSDFQVVKSNLPARKAWERLLEIADREEQWCGLLSLQLKSGELVGLHATVFSSFEKKGGNNRILIVFNDANARNERDVWRHMAHRHDLTNLPNRRSFHTHIASFLRKADETASKVAFFYIDVDGFKFINDMHGHATGDEVLKGMGRRFKELPVPPSQIFHFSGDEFVILYDYHDDANVIIECIQQICKEPIETHKGKMYTQISIGASIYPLHSEDPASLLEYADEALFLAKKRSGTAFNLYKP